MLTEAGYADVAYRLLLNETFPSWGYSIRHGATTIWERWDGWTEEHGFQTPMMNSFNHYSLGSVAQWLYEYVAGIRPAKPGYEHVLIAPEPGPLEWARATYRSVRGPITSAWRQDGDVFRLDVEIPANVTATVDPARRRDAATSARGAAASAPRGRHSASSFARARARSSDRVRTPSLVYTWLRWNSTVLVLTMSCSATSRFVIPETTSRATASS